MQSLQIRKATLEDLAVLPAVERDAAQTFREIGYDFCVDDIGCTPPMFAEAQGEGALWVAAVDGAIGGFALLWHRGGWAHLHELDVMRSHQGRGIGRALVEAAARDAAARGCDWLSLTTFREVPWNAPFYARLGFEEFDSTLAPEALAPTIAEELAAATDQHPRLAMRRRP